MLLCDWYANLFPNRTMGDKAHGPDDAYRHN